MDKRVLAFLIITLIAVFLQLVLFVPVYFVWKKDCKEIGKENLASSLGDRFKNWLVLCPIWLVPIIIFLKGE